MLAWQALRRSFTTSKSTLSALQLPAQLRPMSSHKKLAEEIALPKQGDCISEWPTHGKFCSQASIAEESACEDSLAKAYLAERQAFVLSEKAGNKSPYPHAFKTSLRINHFIDAYCHLAEGQRLEGTAVSLAGRTQGIQTRNGIPSFTLHSDGYCLEVIAENLENCSDAFSKLRNGDIIGVTGFPAMNASGLGTPSIILTNLEILSPCLRKLPTQQSLASSPDTRYRQRYLDLILNPETRKVFSTRSKIIQLVREILNEHDFFEAETPVLNLVAGGATAVPFVTRHNELDMDLYLRVAPELYLKQLIVGGLERVFEIGRQFRNEGLDSTHNPEFTTCEFYWAYTDYYDLMTFTEQMLARIVLAVKGSYKFEYCPEGCEPVEIDFTPPFRRISLVDAIEAATGASLPSDLNSIEAHNILLAVARQYNVDCSPQTTARLLDKLTACFIESQCVNPTYIIDHPQLMSPLSKYHRKRPGLSERFELFINHHEYVNAYTDQNDPFAQRELFEVQAQQRKEGDDEAQQADEDFCVAMEHAFPPTAGWGLGIDRLAMLLTNKKSIKDVLLFPTMPPRK